MPEALQRLKSFNETEQVVYFHSRERRLSKVDPAKGLFRTHLFAIPTDPLPTASFPNALLAAPATFRTRIEITGATLGTVFEFGDSTAGIAVALDSQNIFFAAGNGGVAHAESALITFDNGAAWPVGLLLDIVAATIPGEGTIRLWLNGDNVAKAQAASSVFTNGRWADQSNGSFNAAPNGTINLDIPVGSRIAPSGFSAVQPLNVYARQRPRDYLAV